MAVRKKFVRQQGSFLVGMTMVEMQKIADQFRRAPYNLKFGLELRSFTNKYGQCRWYGTETTIAIDRAFATHGERRDIKDTLLHEIAHALAGPHAGHGPLWQDWCRKIGAKPVRCGEKTTSALSKIWSGRRTARTNSVVGACGCAKDKHTMTRKPKVGLEYTCKLCRVKITWTSVN